MAAEEMTAVPQSGVASAWPDWPGAERPAGWSLSASGEAAPPVRSGTEPARADAAQPAEHSAAEDQQQVAGSWSDDGWCPDPQPTRVYQAVTSQSGRQEPQADAAPHVPVVGPTAALHGHAGGPGFTVRPGAVYGDDQSGWQRAQGIWQESGISWEPPATEPQPEPAWSEQAGGSFGESWPADGHGQAALSPPDLSPQDLAPPDLVAPAVNGWQPGARWADSGRAGDWQPGDWQPDQQPAPAFASAPTITAAGGRGLSEPDELYRAWQGSVRRASAGGRSRTASARRHQAWQVIRVGVPVAVLVTVGVGAIMMLTGKTGEMLDSRASQGRPAPPASGRAVAFPGYPGQHGTVTVNAISTAGSTRLGVGSADGHPAIWRRAAGGAWSLVSASSPAVYQRPGAESLTSVAHGPAGWIAVGGAVSGTAQLPVVVTSSDGVSWHAVDAAVFASPGAFVSGVTAGQHGYVIVGKQTGGGRTIAAMWWSADLRNWLRGSNGGLDGRLKPSTVFAVGAATTGFVAAGTHGGCHTIWTSADGRNWTPYDVPRPPGATDALLSQVAVNGTRVVTAGYAVGKAGPIPVVVTSADGGRHWRQVLLPAPGGRGAVTALTAAGNGFVAAGQAGPAWAQHAVTWSSPDGLTWSAATPVSAGQITALSASGGTAFGTAQRAAGPSVVTFTAP
ncbi:MAG TPA: hypothetical protein VH589_02025 [Trebonia sp.]